MSTKFSIRVRRLDDVTAYWPAFSKAWAVIKAECNTKQRGPKSVRFTDEPEAMYLNDYECGRRFAVELETGRVLEAVHVSAGECAIMNRGEEKAMDGVPAGVALVSCAWNDFYRSFSMTIQVAAGTLAPQLEARAS